MLYASELHYSRVMLQVTPKGPSTQELGTWVLGLFGTWTLRVRQNFSEMIGPIVFEIEK